MDGALIFPAAATGDRFPTTRSQGRTRRAELDELLSEQPTEVLIIDFTEVQAMTISYADEFLGKFLASFDATHTGLVVAVLGLNTENLEAVQIALERRNTNVVHLLPQNQITLLGDPRLRETFDAARNLTTFRAGQLAAQLGITPQNANNRLKPLVEVGALRRTRLSGATRGGKEFLYSTIQGTEPHHTQPAATG